MNGNTEIKLGIKQAWGIMITILIAGVWLGVNVINTKNEVSELKTEFKKFNEKLTKITISVAILAANKRSNGHD